MELDRFIGKLAKWAFIMEEFDFDIIHRPVGLIEMPMG
jgi:hypothetical protein